METCDQVGAADFYLTHTRGGEVRVDVNTGEWQTQSDIQRGTLEKEEQILKEMRGVSQRREGKQESIDAS